jgi:HD-GYP domain-containing protein (c-di-GMP phosphodiesterase class II)
MTTDRPYRTAHSLTEALNERRVCRGTHFDPDVVDCLLAIHDVQERAGRSADTAPDAVELVPAA